MNKRKSPIDFQQRFLPRELNILQKIDHPHIIKLFDMFHYNHKVNDYHIARRTYIFFLTTHLYR